VDVFAAVDVPDLERDVGMLFREFDTQPVHDIPQAPPNPNANPILLAARHLAGDLTELSTRRVERPRFLEQAGAVFGQRDPMPMAKEEREAEFFLELMDVTAERRLRDVKAFGSLGDTQGVRHGNEGLYVPKVHGGGILYQIRMA
jgi:hypothetical protein